MLLVAPASGNPGQASTSAPPDRGHVAMRKPQRWTSLGLSGGGAIFTPSISPVDPNLMLLNCDMSGVYRSTDGGKHWELIHYRQLTSSTSVRPAWHPTDSDVAFAAGGWRGPLKVTRDRGQTWSEMPSGPTVVSAIGIDPGRPELMLVAGRRGICRSTDGGKSWRDVGAVRGRLLGFHFDQTSPSGKRTCFAATDRGVFRSDDGGTTWRDVGAGLGSEPILSFAGGSNQASKTCVLYCSVESREVSGHSLRTLPFLLLATQFPNHLPSSFSASPLSGCSPVRRQPFFRDSSVGLIRVNSRVNSGLIG